MQRPSNSATGVSTTGVPSAGASAATLPTATSQRQRSRESQSLYTDLCKDIREGGLLRRRYAYYWSRIALAISAFAVICGLVVVLGDSWFQLIPAAAMGILSAQFGFLGHDAAHRQMFNSAAWNEWTSRLLSALFIGMSFGWWKSKHNQHHAAPNQADRDPDIGPGAIAFTREIAASRTTGFPGWFTNRQGWLFFPLLTLEGFNLSISSVRTVLRPGAIPHQRVEAALILGRLPLFIGALLLVLPYDKALAFIGVQMGLFGLCLGASFAPSHKGMPIVPRTMKIDFLRRQVLMSRNVRGGLAVDFLMGGLNYQIEHHLFPSMPRPNLKLAQPIVRAYCEQHDVSYTEAGLFESYGIVVDYLNHVGLRASEPFACPLVSAYRA
jgi:fatty acid desaturase